MAAARLVRTKPATPATLRPGEFFGAVDGAWHTPLVKLSTVHHAKPREVPLHSHEHLYLTLLVRGGYREWVGARRFDYEPLTVVFHPEHLVHRDEITAPDSLFFICEANPALLDATIRRRKAIRSVQDLSGGPAVWAMLRLYEALRARHREDLDGEEPVAEILDLVLGEPASPRSRPRWLGAVEAALREGYRAPVSLRALSAEADVHPVHLARVFRRTHGCTMRTFVQRLRVLDASRAIARREPIAAVATGAGFFDQSHLTHVFRAVTGMTPAAYRRSIAR